MFKTGNNVDDNYRDTLLMLIVKNSHREAVLALIERGANVNDKDIWDSTPLMWAAGDGLREVVLALIEKGANVNDKDKSGKTPLIYVAENGHEDVVLALIEKGANVNDKDNNGYTPLMLAVEKGHGEVVKLLKEKIAEGQNKKVVTVQAVTDITYDNELLNHPELLKKSLKDFTLNQIIDMSLNLDQRLVDEALNSNDSSLVLAGLISLAEENNYE